MEMKVGHGDIARIADDVDEPLVTKVDVFMALNHARPWNRSQKLARHSMNIGNQGLDIGEAHGLIRVEQICNQEASPGVPRAWVGNDEGVVRLHVYLSSRN